MQRGEPLFYMVRTALANGAPKRGMSTYYLATVRHILAVFEQLDEAEQPSWDPMSKRSLDGMRVWFSMLCTGAFIYDPGVDRNVGFFHYIFGFFDYIFGHATFKKDHHYGFFDYIYDHATFENRNLFVIMMDGKFTRLFTLYRGARESQAVSELCDQMEIARKQFRTSKFFAK